MRPGQDQSPFDNQPPDSLSLRQWQCERHASAGTRDCWDERSDRRSAPKPGEPPAEPPIHHVRNAPPPLPASGLRQPDPADVAGSIAFRQHVMARTAMIDGALASAIATVWSSRPDAPLLRTTFSSAVAKLASDATASSNRLASATPVPGPLVVLLLALCSRKLRRSDASDSSVSPLPEGLSANARLNCRGPVFLNPSPPLLHRLSPASSLLRGDPTSVGASFRRRCLLRVYRSRGPPQTSPGKVHWMSRRSRPPTTPASIGFWASRSKTR